MTTPAFRFFLQELDKSLPGYSWPLWDKYPQISGVTEPERGKFIAELIEGYSDETLPHGEVLLVLEVLGADELVPLVTARWDAAIESLSQPCPSLSTSTRQLEDAHRFLRLVRRRVTDVDLALGLAGSGVSTLDSASADEEARTLANQLKKWAGQLRRIATYASPSHLGTITEVTDPIMQRCLSDSRGFALRQEVWESYRVLGLSSETSTRLVDAQPQVPDDLLELAVLELSGKPI